MANTLDLIPLARACQNLPSLGGTGQDTALASLITTADIYHQGNFPPWPPDAAAVPVFIEEACENIVAE